MSVFTGRVFDTEVFANYPKCVRDWVNPKTGAGCLLTAFWAALGFKPEYFYTDRSAGIYKLNFVSGDIRMTVEQMMQETDELAIELIGSWERNYSDKITYFFDYENFDYALYLIVYLIKKLPQKQPISEADVKMPCVVK